MMSFEQEDFLVALQKKIDTKTKPMGALGRLESLAFQIGRVQQTLTPELKFPKLFVFAADHGIAQEGVSAYPSEVTYQMVLNFLNGGAAINVFCLQHNIALDIVDAGVNADLTHLKKVIHKKVDYGTQNFLHVHAMTQRECQQAFTYGQELIDENDKSSVFCFGEMGIGNTSAASIIMSLLCGEPIENCVGRGTGLSDQQYAHKLTVLREAMDKHSVDAQDPMVVLAAFGGFEIAMMTSAMLTAAKAKKLIVVDGFIATAAFLVAHCLYADIMDYAVFSHVSDERGHQKMLAFLGADPLLKLDLRLGEGTGCALAYPLIQSAVNFLNDMASFESAGVSQESND
ncbi:MAG: nicotinate-nucleotide--dimethylbenzimidazole phosphoribosyltransferase [Bacteroidota bacterium]